MQVTWSPELTQRSEAAFDEFVLASPAGHPSQTRAWGAVASAGAHVTSTLVVVSDGARLAGTALLLRGYAASFRSPWASIERGPVVAAVEDLGSVLECLGRTARSMGIAKLRVMPYWDHENAVSTERVLQAQGYRNVQRPDGAHATTLRLDLAGKNDEQLFAGASKEQVRWRAGQAERAGARARLGGAADWACLQSMHGALMRSQGKRGKSDAWWKAVQSFAATDRRGALFACDYQGQVVAACLVFRHGRLATYALGASHSVKLPFSKAVLPLVAAIRWARDVGCSTFDLGGVPMADDSDPKRNAIATFKYDFDRHRVPLTREHARWLIP
jgi:lipid II:glycine glycyltransferase (peptidoglycan interpeptide bridge formation enzyme)